MNDSALLESLVNQYELSANGAKFWAPYFINNRDLSPDPDKFLPGPYKGKGTPQQINSWLRLHARQHPEINTAMAWRSELIARGVGVDCSGYVYYLLDGLLQSRGQRLWDYLYIPKKDILSIFKDAPERVPTGVTKAMVEKQPDQIKMSHFCRQWGKDPRRNTNVARLISPAATKEVNSVGEAQPGDMLDLRGPDGDHIGLVVYNDSFKLLYTDSIGLELKGVSKYEVKVTKPDGQMQDQDWGENKWYVDRYDFRGLRRLKGL